MLGHSDRVVQGPRCCGRSVSRLNIGPGEDRCFFAVALGIPGCSSNDVTLESARPPAAGRHGDPFGCLLRLVPRPRRDDLVSDVRSYAASSSRGANPNTKETARRTDHRGLHRHNPEGGIMGLVVSDHRVPPSPATAIRGHGPGQGSEPQPVLALLAIRLATAACLGRSTVLQGDYAW